MSAEVLDTYPKYDSYKDSGVDWLGDVPSDWDVIKLKHLVSIRKRIIGHEGVSVLSITQKGIKVKNITSGGGQLSMDYSKYQVVDKGDFAMNHMDLLTGYVDISKFDGVVSPDYRVFTNDSQNADDSYLLKIFQMGYAQKIFFKYGQGVSMLGRWRLPADNFNEFLVPLPPLNEQEKIISFLDNETTKIDQAIELKQQQIEKLNEYKQITIQNAVTKGLDANIPMKDSGIDWIGDIPEHWEIKKLKFLCDFDTGNKDTVNAIDDGKYPLFVRSPNIEGINEYTHDCEAVLTAGDGAGVGKVFHYYVGKFCFHQRVYMFNNFREVSGKYFYLYFLSLFHNVALDGSAKSTVDSLRRSMISNFMFVIPKTNEQEYIVEYIEKVTDAIDLSINSFKNQIERLKEYKTILINQAVTGKIKVS
ncbi:restriction endonuclease subunit S [Psychrobacter immobilis]|uniref:restriction endonuclease subunit S n=1 Tax=Psychrobacter immobilis TaxID=498 RepID=UPI0019182785|nr:restriction endonuclease subunit S [Psychrobacter immobilis]